MVFAFESRARAEENGIAIEAIRHSLESIPMCSIEWDVVRVIAPNPVAAQKIGNPAFASELAKGQSIPMRVKIDYVNRSRFYIHHEFRYENGPVDYEYYSLGDGVIYAVNNTIRRVRLLTQDRSVLLELARGLPQLQLIEIIKNAKSPLLLRQAGDYALIGPSSTASHGFVINLGLGKLDALKLRQGTFVVPGKPDLVGVTEEIIVTKQNPDITCPVPTELVYRKFDGRNRVTREEVWRLLSWSRKSVISELHAQKYALQPNYHVKDETGSIARSFLSNEVLRAKK